MTETIANRVRRDRIRVAVAAWAYENAKPSPLSDADYDALSDKVQKHIKVATGNSRLDNFFKRHFTPHTGLWIHKHPDTDALRSIYYKVHYKRRRNKPRNKPR